MTSFEWYTALNIYLVRNPTARAQEATLTLEQDGR